MRVPRTIVIIGAGFGGLGVARALERRAEAEALRIVLIDKRPFHEFHALLYEVATGRAVATSDGGERELARGARVNVHEFARMFSGGHVTFRCTTVTAIDRLTRRVLLREGGELAYDALVLALGAETAYYGIPGLQEHAIPLKTVQDALRIRRRLLDGVAMRTNGEQFRVVVGGGGATGVEFAAELANHLRRRVERREIAPGSVEMTLVEGASRVLTAFPERFSRVALRRLRALGVRVLLDSFVQRVALDSVTVVPRPLRDREDRARLLCGFDGASLTIPADLVVWTGGMQYPALPSDAGFPCDAKGRVLVAATLAVPDVPGVFVLGDGAAMVHEGAPVPLPPLASVAVREAPIVAANVIAFLDEMPLRPFRGRVLPAIVPLGGKYAGIAYRRWTWVGRAPWCLHLMIALRYFIGVLGVRAGIRMWWHGSRAYTQND